MLCDQVLIFFSKCINYVDTSNYEWLLYCFSINWKIFRGAENIECGI